MAEQPLSKEEFCARFEAHMIAKAGFSDFLDDDGVPSMSVAEYSRETAPLYYDDYIECQMDDETPEELAEADMSYWGED